MEQPFSPVMFLDISDVLGQLSSRFEHICRHVAEVFARWILDQGLMMNTLHLLTRSHLIVYRKYLGENNAQATATRMFSVARRIQQEYVYRVILMTDLTTGIMTFPVPMKSHIPC